MLGLSVPASAAFDAEDSQNINHINTNVWKLTSAFVDSVASFTWDQNNNAQLSPAQYFAYAWFERNVQKFWYACFYDPGQWFWRWLCL